MHGEIYSYLMDKLLLAGALDVTYTSLQMKKNRPGIKVTVLCNEHNLEHLEHTLLTETSTFGVRKYPVSRKILDREFRTIESPLGLLTFKYGYIDGSCIKITPEYEELKKISEESEIPLIAVYQIINSFIEKELLI